MKKKCKHFKNSFSANFDRGRCNEPLYISHPLIFTTAPWSRHSSFQIEMEEMRGGDSGWLAWDHLAFKEDRAVICWSQGLLPTLLCWLIRQLGCNLELPEAEIQSPLSQPVSLLYAPLRERILYYLKLPFLSCWYSGLRRLQGASVRGLGD